MFRRFDEYLADVAGFVEENNPANILVKVTNDLVYTCTQIIGTEKCCLPEEIDLAVVGRKAIPPTHAVDITDVIYKGIPLFSSSCVNFVKARYAADVLPGQIRLNFDCDCIRIKYWALPTDDCGKILIPEVIYETAVSWAQAQQMKSPRARRIHGNNMYASLRQEAILAANRAKNRIDQVTPMQMRTLMSTARMNFVSHHDYPDTSEI